MNRNLNEQSKISRKRWVALLLALPLTACGGQTGAPAGSVPAGQSPVQTPDNGVNLDEEPVDEQEKEESKPEAEADNEAADPKPVQSVSSPTKDRLTANLTGQTETIADNLDTPWEIQFDGSTIYMPLRGGSIMKVQGGERIEQSITMNAKILEEGEGGLLGMALAPDFAKSRQAYVYHTYEQGDQIRNRVIRIQENSDGTLWSETAMLLEHIPGARVHDGGRIAFGKDGMLYVTTGDAQQDSLAQDPSSLAGKILRMTPEGKVPEDNPIPDSYVYSYGHRNSQGIDWTADGTLYASEHGPSGDPGGHDEMNQIQAGGNYGWPTVMGDENQDGLIPPLYHTGEEAIAPSGIAATPEGTLLVANLAGQSLMEFDPQTKQMKTVIEGLGRIRDVAVHEGQIYIVTNNTDGRGSPSAGDDRLLRLK
ncbi:quinoprotein glucose dehydrogenase [Saccharibacillus sp. O16]|nr:quinoprotein glucose dehydrogenase [Saccharibacillus sp. O16]